MSEETSKMIVSVENISVYFCEQFKHYLAPQSNTQSGQIIFSIGTCLGFIHLLMALYKSTAMGNTHREKWNEKAAFNKIPIACHITLEFELHKVEEKEKTEETTCLYKPIREHL